MAGWTSAVSPVHGTASPLAFTSANVGDIIWVTAAWSSGGGTLTVTSGAVGGGFNYTTAQPMTQSSGFSFQMAWGVVTATGSNPITVSTSAGTIVDISAGEVTPPAGTSSVAQDGSQVFANAANATIAYPSLTPSGTSDFYLGTAAAVDTPVAGSTTGFTYYLPTGGNLEVYSLDAPNPSAPTGTTSGGNGWDAIAVLLIPTIPPTAPVIVSEQGFVFSPNIGAMAAWVQPTGASTTVSFDWGTTTGYGSNAGSVTLAASLAVGYASETLTGLTSGETVHFRAVATNSASTVYGTDTTFETASVPAFSGITGQGLLGAAPLGYEGAQTGGAATTASAGLAAASVVAYAPTIQISGFPGTGAASASAYPTVQGIQPTAGLGAASATAYVPTVGIGAAPSLAAASATAYQPAPAITVFPTTGAASATAYSPTIISGPVVIPNVASASAGAYSPSIAIAFTPGIASASAAAYQSGAQIGGFPVGIGAASATAYLPTSAVNPAPSLAGASAAAYSPSLQVTVIPTTAAATATANEPEARGYINTPLQVHHFWSGRRHGQTIIVGGPLVLPGAEPAIANPSTANANAAAYSPTINVQSTGGLAAASATAYTPSIALTVGSGVAGASASAYTPLSELTVSDVDGNAAASAVAYTSVSEVTIVPIISAASAAAYAPLMGPVTPTVATASASAYAPAVPDYDSVVLSDSPIAYWPLNDANGSGTVADLSGNGYTGTVTSGQGTLGDSPGPTPSDFTNDYANLALTGTNLFASSSAPQTSATAWSAECWINTTSTQTNQPIMGDRGSAGSGKSLTMFYGGNPLAASAGTIGFGVDSNNIFIGVHTTSTYNDGNWHHIVGTWTGSGAVSSSQFKIYVDGVAVATSGNSTGSASSPLSGSGGEVIGGNGTTSGVTGYGDTTAGNLARVAVYGVALSATQVSHHYNAAQISGGIAVDFAPGIAAASVVAYEPSVTTGSSVTVVPWTAMAYAVTLPPVATGFSSQLPIPAGLLQLGAVPSALYDLTEVTVLPLIAGASAAAYNPTVSDGNIVPGIAGTSAAAYSPTIIVDTLAGFGAASASAYTPTVAVEPVSGVANAGASALIPGIAIEPVAGLGSATAQAFSPIEAAVSTRAIIISRQAVNRALIGRYAYGTRVGGANYSGNLNGYPRTAPAFGVALGPTVTADPTAGLAGASASAYGPLPSITFTPGVAGASAAAYQPNVSTSSSVTASAGLAGASANAYASTADVTGFPSVAGASTTGFAPGFASAPTPGVAGASATAYGADIIGLTITPGIGAASTTAYAPTITTAATITPGVAGASAVAYAPNISAGGSVTPYTAPASTTAYAPGLSVEFTPGVAAAAAAAAYAPLPELTISSSMAAASALANAPAAEVQTSAGEASVTASVQAPGIVIQPGAGLAAAVASATSFLTVVPQSANAFGVAYNASVTAEGIVVTPFTALVTATAYTPTVIPSSGLIVPPAATAMAQAFIPTVIALSPPPARVSTAFMVSGAGGGQGGGTPPTGIPSPAPGEPSTAFMVSGGAGGQGGEAPPDDIPPPSPGQSSRSLMTAGTR